MSREAADLGVTALLSALSNDDLLPGYRAVVNGGWEIDDGAVLLRRFHKSYHGDRERFHDVTSYESAVNSRGIHDQDLELATEPLTRRLMARGLAFAWAALAEANRTLPDVSLTAYVYVQPTLYDPAIVTGFVGFSSPHEGELPYLDVEQMETGVFVSLESADCEVPLPVGTARRGRSARGWLRRSKA